MAQSVIAIAFDKQTRADEVLLSVSHLQGEHVLKLADAVVAVKDMAGHLHLRQTTDPSAGQGATSGGWWGAFIGLILGGPIGLIGGGAIGAAAGGLYGKLVDTGLDDVWIKETAAHIAPGTSAIFLLTEIANREVALHELGRFEGTVLYTDLPPDTRALVEQELAPRPL